MVLGEQTLVEDLLQRPPHGLDVLGVHGPVGVVQVDPVAHAGRELGERVGVAGHGLAALGVELGDAVRLDVLLAVEAQLLLDGELDGQAVAVPAGLAGHVVAAHRAEAGEDVLEDAGLDVVRAGHAVRGGRALVEDPLGAALGLLQGLGEGLALAPEVEDRVLKGRQVDLGGYRAVLRRCGHEAELFLRRGVTSVRRDESRLLLPRYHPPWPPDGSGGPLIGVRSRFYSPSGRPAAFFRRLRGDPSRRARPRALTVPGSLLAASDATRPRPCLSLGPVYGPGGHAADRFTGAPAGPVATAWRGRGHGDRGGAGSDPNGPSGTPRRGWGGSGGLPGFRMGTTDAG